MEPRERIAYLEKRIKNVQTEESRLLTLLSIPDRPADLEQRLDANRKTLSSLEREIINLRSRR